MKLLIVVLAVFCFGKISFAQSFAPVGATWHYTQNIFSNFTEKKIFKIESTRDSLFAGKNCRLLVKNEEFYCEDRPLQVLVYEEDSVVFFWDEAFDEFQILYDLKKEVNGFWHVKVKATDESTDTITVTVTARYERTINSTPLQVLDVNYNAYYHLLEGGDSWNSEIIERMGDTTFLFNFHPQQSLFCDVNFSGGLRCYEDNVLGFYANNSAPSCEYETLALEDLAVDKSISVHPNPSNGEFSITNSKLMELTCSLYSATGQKIMETMSSAEEVHFDGKIEPGIYLLRIDFDDNRLIRRIVVR